MRSFAAEVVATRKSSTLQRKDLLNAITFEKDVETGKGLSDESVQDEIITFLIAGGTTAGLLSFTSYYLLKNPEALRKAQEEVDGVAGKNPITFQHMSKLPYTEAVLRESLRLSPAAPTFAIRPLPGSTDPVIIGGKYTIPKDQTMIVVMSQVNRDPAIFGDDADLFKPERLYGENFSKLPPGAQKGFGNGARACLGRPFSWQSAVLALAMILQNFNLFFDDPSYELKMDSTLTIKPKDFSMKASMRAGIDPIKLQKVLFGGLQESK